MVNQNPKSSKLSIILGKDDNDIVSNLLGNRCQSLATAVIQLFLTDIPQHNKWTKRICGVACFIKDNSRRSYFIRVFNMNDQKLEWEQELYAQFKYRTPRQFFHTFEAEGGVAGLNFADDQEASLFQAAIQDRLKNRELKIEEKKKANSKMSAATSTGVNAPATQPTGGQGKIFNTLKMNKKDKKKIKFTKADIGDPTNFQHVSHVGWNPAKGLDGFQHDKQDTHMNKLFEMVGISDKQLEDEETRAFIYDFIDRQGFRETLQKLNEEETTPPPVPARQNQMGSSPTLTPAATRHTPPARPMQIGSSPTPTPPASRHPPPAPPAPPARVIVPPPPPPSAPPAINKPKTSPTVNWQMGTPPPPPPSRNLPPPPPTQFSHAVPPAASAGAPPPPPPPPPPPVMMAQDVADEMLESTESSASGEPDVRSALLADIRSKRNLKPVQRDDSQKPANSRNELLGQIRLGVELRPTPERESCWSSRDQLLGDIRKGVVLKHVERGVSDTPRPPSEPPGVLDGMANALARALAERSRAIHSSDDSGDDDEDDEDDDDDWDD